MKKLALIAVLLLAPLAARADDAAPPPAPSQEQAAVQAWGASHSDCIEWTDACVTCTAAGCSTPGIACTPGPIVCRRSAAPPDATPSKPAQ